MFFFLDLMILFFIFVILLFSLYEMKYEEDFGSINSLKFYLYFSVVCILLVVYGILKFRFLTNEFYSNGLYFFDYFYIINDLIIFGKCFVSVITIICLLLAYSYLKMDRYYFIEYIVFVLLALPSIYFFLSAADFFIAYITIEMQAFCFYIIFSLTKQNNFALESSLKYFILSVFASLILLLGIGFIYGSCGTLKFYEINLLLSAQLTDFNLLNIYVLGLFFFFIGILFKLAIVPFHYWIGDIYEGLPLITLVWYASVAKIPFIIFLINFLHMVIVPAVVYDFLFYLSILSIVFGALAGLYQSNFMRLLAFGAINHAGFILLGISFGTLKGFSAALVYLIVYTFLIIGTFASIILLKIYGYKLESWNIADVVKFIKMSKFNYIFSIVFSSFILSFAGIPPFAGFFAKLGIFMVLIDSANYFTFIFVAIFSIVSAVYYIRLVRFLFFSKDSNDNESFFVTENFSQFVYWVIIFCFLFNVFFFFLNVSFVYFFFVLVNF